jgi:hypothetical protein
MMEPWSGLRPPVKRLKTVVLPAPLGPIRPKISPSTTSKERFHTAGNRPKCLWRLFTARISDKKTSPLPETSMLGNFQPLGFFLTQRFDPFRPSRPEPSFCRCYCPISLDCATFSSNVREKSVRMVRLLAISFLHGRATEMPTRAIH